MTDIVTPVGDVSEEEAHRLAREHAAKVAEQLAGKPRLRILKQVVSLGARFELHGQQVKPRPVAIDFQGDDLVCWFESDDSRTEPPLETTRCWLLTTGSAVPAGCRWVGLAQTLDHGLPFVVHLYVED